MKKTLIFFLLSIPFITGSCASYCGVEATVVRDCTGAYIRVAERDYLVCNKNAIESFNEGDKVRVRFCQIDKCPELDSIVTCLMFHQNEGLIRLKRIRKF